MTKQSRWPEKVELNPSVNWRELTVTPETGETQFNTEHDHNQTKDHNLHSICKNTEILAGRNQIECQFQEFVWWTHTNQRQHLFPSMFGSGHVSGFLLSQSKHWSTGPLQFRWIAPQLWGSVLRSGSFGPSSIPSEGHPEDEAWDQFYFEVWQSDRRLFLTTWGLRGFMSVWRRRLSQFTWNRLGDPSNRKPVFKGPIGKSEWLTGSVETVGVSISQVFCDRNVTFCCCG